MNRTVRILISALVTTLILAVVGIFGMRSREMRMRMTCSSLEVSFSDSLKFVSSDDIRKYLESGYGEYIGQRLDSVGLASMEELLRAQTAIRDVQAWTTDDGVLHLLVSQREPILRFQNGNGGFYVDERGFIFPLHSSYTAPVTCVDGSIPVNVPAGYKGEAPSDQAKAWILKMLEMDRYIKGSRSLRNTVTGIHVDSRSDIYINLNRGEEKFILGQPDNLDSKFSRIDTYFLRIKPLHEENYYKTVNVKYNNQIICRQKDI